MADLPDTKKNLEVTTNAKTKVTKKPFSVEEVSAYIDSVPELKTKWDQIDAHMKQLEGES